MKRWVSLLLVVVLALTMLTGCSDPVSDDLQQFVNQGHGGRECEL